MLNLARARILCSMLAVLPLLALAAGETAASSPSKEIYGADDRKEPFEEQNPAILQLSRAVCVLLYAEYLQENNDGTVTVLSQPNVWPGEGDEVIGLCPDEPYAQQPYVGVCTAFLVAPDLVATAGHCAVGKERERLRILFGWEMIDAQTPVAVVPAEQVYRIAAVVEMRAVTFDHAILRLDREVMLPGVQPLEVRTEGKVPDGALLGIIGHPFGIPKKIAFGAATRVYNNFWPLSFTSNIDASSGNSGSPVINQATGVVEGIYVSSRVDDLLLDQDCLRVNRVEDAAAEQGVMRSTTFAHLIPGNETKPFALCGCSRGGGIGDGLGDAMVLACAPLFLAICARRRRCRAPR